MKTFALAALMAAYASAVELEQEAEVAAPAGEYAPVEGEEYAQVSSAAIEAIDIPVAAPAVAEVADISAAIESIDAVAAPALSHSLTPAITPAIEVAGESEVTAALEQAEANQAISD